MKTFKTLYFEEFGKQLKVTVHKGENSHFSFEIRFFVQAKFLIVKCWNELIQYRLTIGFDGNVIPNIPRPSRIESQYISWEHETWNPTNFKLTDRIQGRVEQIFKDINSAFKDEENINKMFNDL